MNKQYRFQDFLEIIEVLRSENGCPWDKEQTHDSLKTCMIEEAYELVSSIRIYEETKDSENMKEELGDVLLQVVMHSQIAKEEGLFSIEDVIQNAAEKMVRRHPHVFADTKVADSGQVLKNWEDIKKAEKSGKSWIATPLREIPQELPALIRAAKIYKKAGKVYADTREEKESIDKMSELAEQLKQLESFEEDKSKDILGELLMEISNLAACRKINGEQILTDKLEDFIQKHGE